MKTFAIALLVASCALPPAAPHGSVVCGADSDCRVGEVCRFPGVNTRAVCRPANAGESPDYEQP